MPSKGKVKFCYVCAKDVVNGTNLNMHMEKHASHIKFSNQTKDYNKTACKVCGKKITIGIMRSHTQKKHQMKITEYKNRFQQHIYTLEEPIFHRCGICQEILLHDTDSIEKHLQFNNNQHGMTHSEYNQKFVKLAYNANNTQSKENMKSKGSRKVEPSELNSESDNLKSTDNPLKTKETQNQVISSSKTKLSFGTQPEETESVKVDDGNFDIASFRAFLSFLGNGEEGPITSYPTIETILMMDTSFS